MNSYLKWGWAGVLALLVGGVGWSVLAQRGPSPMDWSTDYAAALKQAKAENKVVLIDFWAPWCGHCTDMDMTTYRDPGVKDLTKNLVRLKVNVDENADLSRKYRVDALPAVLLVDADGRHPVGVKGYQSPQDLAAFLQETVPEIGRTTAKQ